MARTRRIRAGTVAASVALAATASAAVVAPILCGTKQDCLATQVETTNLYPKGQGTNTQGVQSVEYVLSGTTTGASGTAHVTDLRALR
jgi:hypothetical protein